MNCYKFEILSEFRKIFVELGANNEKKIGLYCQQRNCIPLNVFFSGVSITYQYLMPFLR